MTFHDLYAQYYSRSLRFVRSYVHNEADAEDIVSDSMMSLWQHRDSDRADTLVPFLYSILRNKSLDYLRRRREVLAGTLTDNTRLGEIDLRISSLTEATQDAVFSSEVKEIIEDALASMPQRTREVFRLSRNDGKTYGEIAQLLSISEKGVEYHMSKAIAALRIALQDYLVVALFLL